MDVTSEEWLTTGQAARIAGRDIRTIRRWMDEGLVNGRVSPGGHRQVALSSLLEAQQPARARGRRRRRGQAQISPLDCLAEWSDTTLDWSGWRPAPTVTAGTLRELISHIDDVRGALDRVHGTVTDAVKDAPAGEDILGWLKTLPVTTTDIKLPPGA